MTLTKPPAGGPLVGLGAQLAGLPAAATPMGGAEFGFRGVSGSTAPTNTPGDVAEGAESFAGKGPLLEAEDHTVWQTLQDLNLRQLRLFQNHLAQDSYWMDVKLGYPWGLLEKVQNQDIYKYTLPRGVSRTSIQAVPNLAWDQVRKATATLLADFPQPRTQPINTTQDAERAGQMAAQFLAQDGGPQGTDDERVFFTQVERSLACASSYNRYWIDPTGGGYVALQIEADPLAVSPTEPLRRADGSVGTKADVILRYVTAGTADEPEGQFTTDPSKAAPMWVPRIRIDQLGREHVRVFPETETVENADQVLIIYYATLAEAKRRWPDTVGTMEETQLAELCDWTPPQYLPLLPLQLRARWRIQTGNNRERSGSNDQRLMFYYTLYQRPVPEYREGAILYSSGAFGGFTLGKQTLAMPVKVPTSDGNGDQTETRCMSIPVIQITPVQDPDERDPSGRAYMELFGGAAVFAGTLATNYLEKVDLILHAEGYINATSPVQGGQREDARVSGDLIPIEVPGDLPIFAQQSPLPPNFWDSYNTAVEQVQSIASLPRPLVGADNQQEVSGKSRQIAVQQGQVGLGPMSSGVNAAIARHYNIKLQLAQWGIPVPIMIRFIGEDGAYKQESFNAVDFALVGDIDILPGTGTMMTPDARVNYVSSAKQAGLISADEAQEIARQVFGDLLGGDADPHGQRAERCLAAWLQGPPPGWLAEQERQAPILQAFQQQQAQWQQVSQQAQSTGQPAPPQPQPPQLPVMATPFEPLANDNEVAVAETWMRVLSRAMSSTRYQAQPKPWRDLLDARYNQAIQIAIMVQIAGVMGNTPGAGSYMQMVQKGWARITRDLAVDMASIITAPDVTPASNAQPPQAPKSPVYIP